MVEVLNRLRVVLPISILAALCQFSWIDPAAAQSSSGSEPALVLRSDDVVQNAGGITNIDVLANDSLRSKTDGEQIEVVAQPQCGIVTPSPGRLSYHSLPECQGYQVFYYGIAGSPAFAEVTVLVRPAPPQPELTVGTVVIDRVAGTTRPETDDPQPLAKPILESAGETPATPTFEIVAARLAKAIAGPLGAVASAVPFSDVTNNAEPAAPAEPATAAEVALASLEAQPAAGPCAADISAKSDIRPAALTELIVTAPCMAGTVAELDYGDLRLGIVIDSNGHGELLVPGFEPVMPAALSFADGSRHEFDLRFSGLTQVDRVAVAWEAPVLFSLNALEFDAEPGSAGHLSPANPRSYNDVRRSGGGFLSAYAPVDGVGQSVQLYTHVTKQSGKAGVVKLMLDYTSRDLGDPATCGDAPLAQPEILLLKSDKGQLARPVRRSPEALGCAEAREDRDRLGDQVGNVLIR